MEHQSKIKWEDFVVQHNIDIKMLDENIKYKIELFEEIWLRYETTDENNITTIFDIEARLFKLDEVILKELQGNKEKVQLKKNRKKRNIS